MKGPWEPALGLREELGKTPLPHCCPGLGGAPGLGAGDPRGRFSPTFSHTEQGQREETQKAGYKRKTSQVCRRMGLCPPALSRARGTSLVEMLWGLGVKLEVPTLASFC